MVTVERAVVLNVWGLKAGSGVDDNDVDDSDVEDSGIVHAASNNEYRHLEYDFKYDEQKLVLCGCRYLYWYHE